MTPELKKQLKEAAMGIVRHGLTTLGGILSASGYISDADATTAVGAVMALAGVGWSVVEKHLRNKETKA